MHRASYWIRVPIFLIWILCALFVGTILFEMRPTLSIGRDLDDLTPDDVSFVLAFVDQQKTNLHIPNSSDMLIRYDPAYPTSWSERICAGSSPALRDSIADAMTQAGTEEAEIQCDPKRGYFFEFEPEHGVYRAGFQYDFGRGSGNLYRLVTFGSVSILIRVGVIWIG